MTTQATGLIEEEPRPMMLKRYNDYVIAIVGTVALFALALLCYAVIRQLLASQSQRPAGIAAVPAGAPLQKQSVFFCQPLTTANSQYQYIPTGVVAMDDAARNIQLRASVASFDAAADASLSCGGQLARSGHITNVVVRNTATGEQHLLLDHPALIQGIELPDDRCRDGIGNVPCGMVLWSLVPQDSNHDGSLDADDAAVDYLSDLAADDLHAVTPADATVLSVRWLPASRSIDFLIRRDLHQGTFPRGDGSELLEWSLTGSQGQNPVQPAIRAALQKSIE